MLTSYRSVLAYFVCSLYLVPLAALRAQNEIGYIESFALAEDRRDALSELIPGTTDYFYYHCLHYQNEKQLAKAEAMLNDWRTKFGESQQLNQMFTRQVLLAYDQNPKRALEHLKQRLGLQFNQRSPRQDRTATLPTGIDAAAISTQEFLDSALAADQSLGQLEDAGLRLVMDRELAPNALRALLKRIDRVDLPSLVSRVAEELRLRDSQGFGWTEIHSKLTLEQLQDLAERLPQLLENERFVRTYTARLVPPRHQPFDDRQVLRRYLERLYEWARGLPESQNSFKALVIGNLLRLDLQEQRFDRALFQEYLALPRAAAYYNQEVLRRRPLGLAKLDFQMQPEVPLPPMADDIQLVRRFLEHFLTRDDDVSDFATWLDRSYLERVQAEVKILYGIGDPATWYAKLPTVAQKELRERIEVRLAAYNESHYSPEDPVQLGVELKNVEQLIVRVYEINTAAYFRSHNRPIDTDIDLDGWVPNVERTLSFSRSPERRYSENLEFPELDGRGVWVVDLLGGGQRSRALIRKGRLTCTERLSDAGHIFQILDEQGQLLPKAKIAFGGREYEAEDGQITIPFAEQNRQRRLVLVHDGFASQISFQHRQESYQLDAKFIVDRQSLVAGKTAKVVVRTRLSCNQQPISLSLLENTKLTLLATDADGVSSSQTSLDFQLSDGQDLVHEFLVPPRLAKLRFELSGKIYNRNRDELQELQSDYGIECNGIDASLQIVDFFLLQREEGFRLYALGRNGEPVAKLPVQVAVTHHDFRQPKRFSLATDERGVIALGQLENIRAVTVQAAGIRGSVWQTHQVHRAWPKKLVRPVGDDLRLPLGEAEADRAQFTLLEVRGGNNFKIWNSHLRFEDGILRLQDLPAGQFRLREHRDGQTLDLEIVSGERTGDFVVGPAFVSEVARQPGLVIGKTTIEDGVLVIDLVGADAASRVHVLATTFVGDSSHGSGAQLPTWPMSSRRIPSVESYYVDSLKLDEEYRYILERRTLKKYVGNMLPQPSLLIRPWEVSVTENLRKEAAKGDMVPPSANADAAHSLQEMRRQLGGAGVSPDWKSYDFLASNCFVLGNLIPEQGQVRVSLKELEGFESLSVIAVHPTSSDSRLVLLPMDRQQELKLDSRDLRLKDSFPLDSHLTQKQRVEILEADSSKTIGDPRTRRFQTYTSIADVFELYGTLLDNADWEQFRFLANWNELGEEQKREKYSQYACHEVNFFLYNKDPEFFTEVVKPFIQQKMSKQLIDHWLLGESLEGYTELWKMESMNALERVLLAKHLENRREGVLRWLNEYVDANPIPAKLRQQRFEVALRRSSLATDALGLPMLRASAGKTGAAAPAPPGGLEGGYGGGRQFGEDKTADTDFARSEGAAEAESQYFGAERLRRGRGIDRTRLYQSLDKTREWAEAYFYQVRLGDQAASLISPNPFWQEYLSQSEPQFLPQSLDLPVSNLNEAICAMAVIDLPFTASRVSTQIEDGQLVLKSETPAVLYLESIENSEGEADESILVGQDIYSADQEEAAVNQKPVDRESLLVGKPYRASVVVTNPTGSKQRIEVLTQLPAGSLPLSGSKTTRSTAVELAPYSTQQLTYYFYFPESGEFSHYGSQVSRDGQHLAATDSRTLRVNREPKSVDETSWTYIADWGSPEQVLQFLDQTNLQEIDVSRIAYRMQDRPFYQSVLDILTKAGRFDPTLWAYSVFHDDPENIEQLLQNRADFVEQLGSVFESPLIDVYPDEQRSYEHLDYKPLTVARFHQLGSQREILNPSLLKQYQELLDILAYQQSVSDSQKLQLCYYLILQNRISEALRWIGEVEPEGLATRMQYDYLSAYLDFHLGEYERAAEIAAGYLSYPVTRWQQLFQQIKLQLADRERLLSGTPDDALAGIERSEDHATRLLNDGRAEQQTRLAAETPTLDLQADGAKITVTHSNLEQLTVRFYLMDIELLFSRQPFVSQAQGSTPVIRANSVKTIQVSSQRGVQNLSLPSELSNKNVRIEVSGGGIVRSAVVTASSLRVDLAEPYGQLQVLKGQGRGPVEGAYVKVFARHQSGEVKFFKDGYTDLRGRFDYASLSTSDLDTTQRFAILVLHPKLGAIVREAAPPVR